jgi:hypothetical protein
MRAGLAPMEKKGRDHRGRIFHIVPDATKE